MQNFVLYSFAHHVFSRLLLVFCKKKTMQGGSDVSLRSGCDLFCVRNDLMSLCVALRVMTEEPKEGGKHFHAKTERWSSCAIDEDDGISFEWMITYHLIWEISGRIGGWVIPNGRVMICCCPCCPSLPSISASPINLQQVPQKSQYPLRRMSYASFSSFSFLRLIARVGCRSIEVGHR